MKISDFRENLRFLRKSRILTKISDFLENLGFLQKSRIFAKISDFRENHGPDGERPIRRRTPRPTTWEGPGGREPPRVKLTTVVQGTIISENPLNVFWQIRPFHMRKTHHHPHKVKSIFVCPLDPGSNEYEASRTNVRTYYLRTYVCTCVRVY